MNFDWKVKALPSVSALIFSADSVRETIECILLVHNYFDEVVLVYSNPDNMYENLLKSVQELNLKNIKVFRTIKISLTEPFKNYALSKCSGDFVMIIDTDERISESLKRNLKKILSRYERDVSAFAIRRNEGVTFDSKKRKHGLHIWWQTRIYRKGFVTWKGFTHEHPTVNGKTIKIRDSDIFIDHMASLQHARHLEYNNFDIVHPGILPAVFFRDVAISILMGKPKIIEPYRRYRYLAKKRTKEFREISRIIKSEGITKYLGLDRDDVIDDLNRRYGNNRGGVELLLNLLLERYHGASLLSSDRFYYVKQNGGV